jgi:hypothetical protein
MTASSDRMYVGGFSISNNKKEWKGTLEAFSLTPTGVNSTAVWKFQDKLNEQAYYNRRVFTHQGALDINLRTMNATQANLVYTAMGIDASLGAAVTTFLLNPLTRPATT